MSLTEFQRGLAASIAWQPIETAPKNGRFILARITGYTPSIVAWQSIKVPFGHSYEGWLYDPESFEEESHFYEYLAATDIWEPNEWFPVPNIGDPV